jgi:hypothetical protein
LSECVSELGREANVEARPVRREEGRDGEQRRRKRKATGV